MCSAKDGVARSDGAKNVTTRRSTNSSRMGKKRRIALAHWRSAGRGLRCIPHRAAVASAS
jgi:hypothetical protein